MAANPVEVRARDRARVLIVDDVASNLLILEAILGRDYDLLVAMTGEEALRLALTKRPDLIVLDIRLPDLDGYEVCRRLKAESATRAIPVIFCTALDEVEDERRGFEAGAVDYVTKPLSEPVVQARVRAHLALSQHSRLLASTVHAQSDQLARLGRLRGFFSPRLAEAILATGEEGALGSHRREITAVRCDLRGFALFNEAAEPEEVMAFLGEYHAVLGRVTDAYDGVLVRFSGESAMVIFNDPVPNEHHAAAALEMALALRSAFGPLAARWRDRGQTVGLAIGMALGYATLGAIGFQGRWDYGVIGRVADLAGRLAAKAETGCILVDPKAMARVGPPATARKLGPLTLEGFSAPVQAWTL
ncbi:MAG: response regulator [Burkholderiales bacterium]|nr:response regulator [Burkholderiales bacterium]